MTPKSSDELVKRPQFLYEDIGPEHPVHKFYVVTIESLERRVAELEKDAGRYRWLKQYLQVQAEDQDSWTCWLGVAGIDYDAVPKSQADTPRKRLGHQNEVELYIKLMDILQEFQLPSGKFDGHGLITALSNAKQYQPMCDKLSERERDLRECVGFLQHWVDCCFEIPLRATTKGFIARLKERGK